MFVYSDEKIQFHHSIDLQPLNVADNLAASHAHNRNEIFYFISGRASYLVEGSVYKLIPGSILIIRSGEMHKIVIEEDLPYERMALHFDSDIMNLLDKNGILSEPFINRPLGVENFYSSNDIRIGHIYECLKSIDSSPEDDEMRRIAITSNLFTILYEIKLAFDERRNKKTINKPVQSLTGEIIAYINANLSSDLSLDMLSEKFFISKNHLNRIFKIATGVTVWEYVKLKRLIMARNSILAGSSAITACQSSGFNDYSAFYRAYKERFGVSPKNNQK
ncbi:MAG: helix-turn-helix transcriptional regulator [Clostridia bacterium]|nr:helix-turn-helix transcriptional regulator [Clostridia bacterium]